MFDKKDRVLSFGEDRYWQCPECHFIMSDLAKKSLRYDVPCRCGRSVHSYVPRTSFKECD